MATSTRILAFALVVAVCSAFAPFQQATAGSKTSLFAAQKVPKFDGDKWVYTAEDQKPSAGYGATKTLLLHGPAPFINRVFQTDDYEQAVLKFMVRRWCCNVQERFLMCLELV